VSIPAADNAAQKAQRIVQALNPPNGPFTATVTAGNKLKLKDLAQSARVVFKDAGTGEDDQTLASTNLQGGSLSFSALFESGSHVTGGFFTDLGSISTSFVQPRTR
jgi:hypothetical protein